MGHDFETRNEISVDATPEQVWAAIATGPGIDSWFMGRNEVEPREGGIARMSVDDAFTIESTVVTWKPPFAYSTRSETLPDGSFHAFEYLVEGRAGGSTVVRLVHSGFIGHDDWESEYDALRKGDPMYLRSLGTYLTYFSGRTASTSMSIWATPQSDEDTAWRGVQRGLGIDGPVTEGAPVRIALPGVGELAGVVDSVLYPSFLGVRTADALLRFVGRGGVFGVALHPFTALDPVSTTAAWQAWFNEVYG